MKAIERSIRGCCALPIACAVSMGLVGAAHAQNLPEVTDAAGTRLAEWPAGGRIATYHRGMLYLGGTNGEANKTWVYDISTNPRLPSLLCQSPTFGNSHVWYKIGDLFFRQDLTNWSSPPAFWDLEAMCLPDADGDGIAEGPARWPSPDPNQPNDPNRIHDFPIDSQIAADDWLPTYPYAISYGVLDARVGWWPSLAERNLVQESGVAVSNRFRIGNLLFLTPGDGGSGVAVYDIGDPASPRLLDVLSGNYLQYTTAWHVWKHYLVMMIGSDINGPAAPDSRVNALVIDFSDVENPDVGLQLVREIPRSQLPGRYVHFQDNYAFAGHVNPNGPGGYGVKYNMAVGVEGDNVDPVELTFSPDNTGTDFQWIPLGNLLLVSGSETNGGYSVLYTHQDGPDVTPPSVAYHHPANGAINLPVTSAVGLVIHEQLDPTTVNESTIQLRPVGADPVPAIVMHTSYDVVSVVPVSPLGDNTTYELRIVAGGIRDVAGNGIVGSSFFFSTGSQLALSPTITASSSSPASPVTAGDSVTLSVTATNATAYRFDPGDGGGVSAWATSSAHTHVYSSPGNYTWQVQARSASGQIATATSRIVVEPAAAPGNHEASASIIVDAAARRVWAVNPDQGTVAVFDADATLSFRLGEYAACDQPRGIARGTAGTVWVACAGSDRVVEIGAGGAIVKTVSTGRGSAPSAIVTTADASTAFVALAGSGELLRVSTAAGTISSRIAIGFDAEALALSGGHVYVARLHSGDEAGAILKIDASNFGIQQEIALPIDRASVDSGTAGRGLPNYLTALAVSPDNQRIWYAAKKDNIERGLLRDGRELNFETTVRAMVGVISPSSASENIPARIDMDNSALTLAMALSPGGSHLFIAQSGNDRIVVLDPWTGLEIGRSDVGSMPRGIAIDPVTNRVWVRNELDRAVTVFDGSPMIDGGGSELVPLASVASVVGPDALPAPVLAGKRLFNTADSRLSADGYIACASCHLDGGADGRVWDFFQRGEGLRRTTRLIGRSGAAHGPIHWSGNFDEVQDFEHDIRDEFSGTGLMESSRFYEGTRSHPLGDTKAGISAHLDNLAAYLGSLNAFGRSPFFRNEDGSLTAPAQAGRELFRQRGCSGCHGGDGFTDSPMRRWHDIGTMSAASGRRLGDVLPGIDTPTLKGLWREQRYLHDGSAATLEDMFDHASANRHGLSGLSAAQRSDLIAYLMSIDDDEAAATAPFALSLATPSSVSGGQTITLGLSTDLVSITQVDYLVDGAVVASVGSAPWRAEWTVPLVGTAQVQARVSHSGGAVTTTWPKTLAARGGRIFRGGFEPAPN